MGGSTRSGACLRGGRARARRVVRWLGGLLAADVRHLHLSVRRLRAAGLARALLGVAVGASGPDGGDLLAERRGAGAAAQRTAQVVPGTGEQAGVELALGREPGAGAAAAGRPGDRGDAAAPPGPAAGAAGAGPR